MFFIVAATKPIIERYGAKPSGWTFNIGISGGAQSQWMGVAAPATDNNPYCPRDVLSRITTPVIPFYR